MKRIRKILIVILVSAILSYACLSFAWSYAYNITEASEAIAIHRNGLLIVGIENNAAYILSPFCNWPDVYLFGIAWDHNCDWWTFSDGLECFGEY